MPNGVDDGLLGEDGPIFIALFWCGVVVWSVFGVLLWLVAWACYWLRLGPRPLGWSAYYAPRE